MSGFPHASLPQQYSLFPSYYTVDENGQPIIQPNAYIQAGGLPGFSHQAPDSFNLGFDFDDSNRTMIPAQGGSRTRRRVGTAGEHVKFRRTRSGCYTCRNRRVKCDEGRPTCERCKKGNRECVYPEVSTTSKPRRGSSKDKTANDEGSSAESAEDDLDEETILLSSISGSSEPNFPITSPELSELSTPILTHSTNSREQSSELMQDEQMTPIMSRANSMTARPRSLSTDALSKYSEDIQFYMRYAKTNMTAYHWNYAPDGSDFLQTALLEAALRYEPLLYAVTCFSAYHHSLSQKDGHIGQFLGYHSRSVFALSQALAKGQKRTIATLLTILQLATIEESLGDWVNLMSHQKAACSILTELYTPKSIMRHPMLRNILKWYMHFDQYVAMLSGTPAVISRDWLEAQHAFYVEEVEKSPNTIVILYEEAMSKTKLISFDIFQLFSQLNTGDLSEAEFQEKATKFERQLNRWREDMHPALLNPEHLVTDFSGAPPRDPDDIVDPYEPGLIYSGDLFPTNQFLLGVQGLKNVFDSRMAAVRGVPKPDGAAQKLAWDCAKVLDAVQHWPGSPKGAMLSFRAIFSLSAFLLPTGEKEIRWMRKKFAAIEAEGYIFPDSIKGRLEAQWGEDLSAWWLPNDENLPPVVRGIREFISERSAAHQDDKSANIRDMRGIFQTLNLSDQSSPESTDIHSPGSSSNLRSDKRSPPDQEKTQQEQDYKWPPNLLDAKELHLYTQGTNS
ncbi:hypothetical protein BT63DRAFT_131299 [Microthyrium microscopicum]|uniref:Zn(2)-C6 fungal-type domain-containing protein n=1 Tax=Microthyrium microscopicum TaxID=703497 RepID=A0A6A6UJY8_9PEZI|nr:hypothetical protein BT63DRAFT_131299 [Microthyrium microscopicum]